MYLQVSDQRRVVFFETAEMCFMVSFPFTATTTRPKNEPHMKKAIHNAMCSELRSCVQVEVDVLGSPCLIVLMVSVDLVVSVDLKQH